MVKLRQDLCVWAPRAERGYWPGKVEATDEEDEGTVSVKFFRGKIVTTVAAESVVPLIPGIREIGFESEPLRSAYDGVSTLSGNKMPFSINCGVVTGGDAGADAPGAEMRVVLDRSEVEKYTELRKEDRLDEDVWNVCKKANEEFLSDLCDDEEGEGAKGGSRDPAPEGGEEVKPPLKKTGKKSFSFGGGGRQPLVQREAEMSEYEKIRQRNIDERKALFEAMKLAAKDLQIASAPRPQKPKNKAAVRRRTAIPYSTRMEPIGLRSRRNSRGSSCQSSDGGSSELCTPLKRRRYYGEFFWDGDEDEEGAPRPKKQRVFHTQRWARDPNVDVPTPEDVTDQMLEDVADFVSEKVYNKANGTSCHQCRQKTLDMKTYCRSGRCAGVRGQFCGVCLKNRYGEDAKVALKDPNWSCPPCNGRCNCSICRNREGKAATGQLTGLALSKGYNSVCSYLESLISSKGCDEFDE